MTSAGSGRRRTEGRGNKAVNDGEDRERVRGEKVGGRNGRLGSGEGRYSSARSTQLAERGPSGSRRPFAKIYTRRHTENSLFNRFLMTGAAALGNVTFGIPMNKEKMRL